MVAAITEGYPQREIADAAYRYQREFDAGERRVVGVNAYVDAAEVTTVPVLSVPPGSFERHLGRLERTRRERDASAVDGALRGLRDAADRPETSETNLMPHFIRCAEAYATLGEQCARPARGLRRVPRTGVGVGQVSLAESRRTSSSANLAASARVTPVQSTPTVVSMPG